MKIKIIKLNLQILKRIYLKISLKLKLKNIPYSKYHLKKTFPEIIKQIIKAYKLEAWACILVN